MNAPANITEAQFRARHVGASEVSALFDSNPWLTKFELFHRKAGSIAVPEFNATNPDGSPQNERVDWGIRLEPAIIEAAKDRYGYTDREQLPHLTNGNGLGGHPDRRVICPERGPGLLEVKMVDWLERKKWGDEPPANYLLQSQTCQGLDGVTWGDVIVLVGGNALERHCYDFRPKLFAEIERRVAEFWQDVRDGNAPKPDYSRDGDTLGALYDPTDTIIDLRLDNRMPELCQEYLDAKEAERVAGCRVDAAKAEILEKLANNTTAFVEGYSCRVPIQGGSPGRLIKPEDVGTIVGAKKASPRFYVKERAA